MSENKINDDFILETIAKIAKTNLESLANLKKDLETPGEARVQVLRMASILNLADGIMPEDKIKAVPQMSREEFERFEKETLEQGIIPEYKRSITDVAPQPISKPGITTKIRKEFKYPLIQIDAIDTIANSTVQDNMHIPQGSVERGMPLLKNPFRKSASELLEKILSNQSQREDGGMEK